MIRDVTDAFSAEGQGEDPEGRTIWVLARCTDQDSYKITLTPPLPASAPLSVTSTAEYGGLHFRQIDIPPPEIAIAPAAVPVTWRLTMTVPNGGSISSSEVEEIFLLLGYEWEENF